jgi:ribosomal protein L12E/L44/L45/RPP1/RPP2
MFNNAICNSGLECVGMSAELLTQAIEGKDIDGLQDKLITIIKSACSKPIKAKPNGPANSTENPPGKKKNKQEEYRICTHGDENS